MISLLRMKYSELTLGVFRENKTLRERGEDLAGGGLMDFIMRKPRST